MSEENALANKNAKQVVVFELYGELFASPIRQVVEIIKPQKLTRMPKAPAYINGVLNLRGQIFPVVDLKRRLSLQNCDVTDKTRIMVAEVEGEPIGLIVDAVIEVLRITEDVIDPPPDLMEEKTGVYLSGVVRDEDRMILMLNLNRLFKDENGIVTTDSAVSEGAGYE